MFNYLKSKQPDKDLSLLQKATCSVTAGWLGSLIGNPADLILIRMQHDTTVEPSLRRGYSNVFQATRIIVE